MTTRFTVADYLALPEGFPAELIGGSLVREAAPTYGHQALASRLHAAVLPFFTPDRVLLSPVDVVLGEHDVYQPDLVVLRTIPRVDQSDVGIPLVAAEILSPATAERDRTTKKDGLLAAGVAEVWILDGDAKRIEIHAEDGARTAPPPARLTSRAIPGFALVPADLFAPPR